MARMLRGRVGCADLSFRVVFLLHLLMGWHCAQSPSTGLLWERLCAELRALVRAGAQPPQTSSRPKHQGLSIEQLAVLVTGLRTLAAFAQRFPSSLRCVCLLVVLSTRPCVGAACAGVRN